MMNTLENQKGRTSKTNKTIPSIPFLHESRPSLHQNASGRLQCPRGAWARKGAVMRIAKDTNRTAQKTNGEAQ